MPSDSNAIIITKMNSHPNGQNGGQGSGGDNGYHYDDQIRTEVSSESIVKGSEIFKFQFFQGGADENALVVSIITVLSMILIVVTFPFSLCACLKMVQVRNRPLSIIRSKL